MSACVPSASVLPPQPPPPFPSLVAVNVACIHREGTTAAKRESKTRRTRERMRYYTRELRETEKRERKNDNRRKDRATSSSSSSSSPQSVHACLGGGFRLPSLSLPLVHASLSPSPSLSPPFLHSLTGAGSLARSLNSIPRLIQRAREMPGQQGLQTHTEGANNPFQLYTSTSVSRFFIFSKRSCVRTVSVSPLRY